MKKQYIQPTTKMHIINFHSMLAASQLGTDDNNGNGYDAGGEGSPVLGKEEGDFDW